MRNDNGALQTFVADRYPRLRRSAFLMGGDWEVAAEQARTTLARLVTRSARGRVHDLDGYAWSDLMRGCQHRPGRREHLFVAAPDGLGEDADTILVLDALHRLTPRCRAVLILRHFDGFTVEDTADLLGLSDDRVEAYAAAGLGALEVLLAGTIPLTDALPAADSGRVAP
jgi:DNA-directed RNA polymerase specialized sigma24 family protein